MKRRTRATLTVAGGVLCLLAAPFLLCGALVGVMAEGVGPFADEMQQHSFYLTVGPLTLDGRAAWIAPLAVGCGGSLGGLGLLIWAWRSQRD